MGLRISLSFSDLTGEATLIGESRAGFIVTLMRVRGRDWGETACLSYRGVGWLGRGEILKKNLSRAGLKLFIFNNNEESSFRPHAAILRQLLL